MKIIKGTNNISTTVTRDAVSVIESGSGLCLMHYKLWNLFSRRGNRNGDDADMRQVATGILEHLTSRGFSLQLSPLHNILCISTIYRGGDRVWENSQAFSVNDETYPGLWNGLPLEVRVALFELTISGLRIPRESLNGTWLNSSD